MQLLTRRNIKKQLLITLLSLLISSSYGQDVFIINPANLAIYDGNLDSTKTFYGLFQGKNKGGSVYMYYIEEINTTDYFQGNRQLNHAKVREDNLTIIFSGISFAKDTIIGMDPVKGDRFLYPGQTFLFQNYHFFALGDIIENKDTTTLEVIKRIDNYKLKVRSKLDNRISESVLIERTIGRWLLADYLGGVFIDWIGDLDGDGQLDILLTDIGHHECFDVEFFISNKDDKSSLMKSLIRYTLCGS